MLWQPKTATADLFEKVKRQQTTERKNYAIKARGLYEGDFTQYALENLGKIVSDPTKYFIYDLNVLRKIVNVLAMVYIEPAQRMIEATDREIQTYSTIQQTALVNSVLKQASRYVKLLGTSALRIVYRNGQLEYDLLTPEILDLETGDSPRDLKALTVTHYPDGGKQDEVTYSRWTPDTFQRLDWRGAIIEETANLYRRLPFVVCWDSMPIDSPWIVNSRPLVSAQDFVNLLLSHLDSVIRWQSYSVGWIKSDMHGPGSEGPFFDGPKIAPGAFVQLGPLGEIGFVNPQASIQEILKSIEFVIQQSAVSYGLSVHMLSTSPTAESGLSKLVSNQELMEQRQDDVELWRGYERQLFDVTRTVWNIHRPAEKISEGAQFRVDFADLKNPDQEESEGSKWQQLIDAGQASPVDWAMSRNPDLNRETAKEYLAQVSQENAELAKAKNDSFAP